MSTIDVSPAAVLKLAAQLIEHEEWMRSTCICDQEERKERGGQCWGCDTADMLKAAAEALRALNAKWAVMLTTMTEVRLEARPVPPHTPGDVGGAAAKLPPGRLQLLSDDCRVCGETGQISTDGGRTVVPCPRCSSVELDAPPTGELRITGASDATGFIE